MNHYLIKLKKDRAIVMINANSNNLPLRLNEFDEDGYHVYTCTKILNGFRKWGMV